MCSDVNFDLHMQHKARLCQSPSWFLAELCLGLDALFLQTNRRTCLRSDHPTGRRAKYPPEAVMEGILRLNPVDSAGFHSVCPHGRTHPSAP
jgi:hypothetical protein